MEFKANRIANIVFSILLCGSAGGAIAQQRGLVIDWGVAKTNNTDFQHYLDSIDFRAIQASLDQNSDIVWKMGVQDAAWLMWEKNIVFPSNEMEHAVWRWPVNVAVDSQLFDIRASSNQLFNIFNAGRMIASGEVNVFNTCREQMESFVEFYARRCIGSAPLALSLVNRLDVSYLGMERNMLYITERDSREDTLTYKNITLKIRYGDDSMLMKRKEIVVAIMNAGAVSNGLFVVDSINSATTTAQYASLATEAIAKPCRAHCPQRASAAWGHAAPNRGGAIPSTVNLDEVMKRIDSSVKSKVLPQQCFAYSGKFDIDGCLFEVSSVTNKIRLGFQACLATESVQGRHYSVIGQIENRMSVSRSGRSLWNVYVYSEICPEYAKEIAIQSFFHGSSMTPKAIANSITISSERLGDFCLSWKSYEKQKDYLVFVKGGVVVIVSGLTDVSHVARLMNKVLDECERSYKKGEVITIETAARKLSNQGKKSTE